MYKSMGIQGSENSNIGLKVNDRLERSQGLNAQEDWCLPALQGVDSKFTWLPIGLYADLGRAEAAVLGGVPKGEGRRLLRGEALQTTGTIALPRFFCSTASRARTLPIVWVAPPSITAMPAATASLVVKVFSLSGEGPVWKLSCTA